MIKRECGPPARRVHGYYSSSIQPRSAAEPAGREGSGSGPGRAAQDGYANQMRSSVSMSDADKIAVYSTVNQTLRNYVKTSGFGER